MPLPLFYRVGSNLARDQQLNQVQHVQFLFPTSFPPAQHVLAFASRLPLLRSQLRPSNLLIHYASTSSAREAVSAFLSFVSSAINPQSWNTRVRLSFNSTMILKASKKSPPPPSIHAPLDDRQVTAQLNKVQCVQFPPPLHSTFWPLPCDFLFFVSNCDPPTSSSTTPQLPLQEKRFLLSFP